MNPRSTQWLIGLALALLAFILVFERRGPAERGPTDPKLLPDLRLDAVTRLDVRRPDQSLSVVRTNGGWRLVAPVDYPAQADAVERLLEALCRLDRRTYIAPEELPRSAAALAEFGLDQPVAILSLQAGSERKELRVGGPTPLGGRVYLQLVGAEGLFAAEAEFLRWLPRTANEWRDTLFLDLTGVNFNRLEIRAADRGFALELDPTNRLWQLVRPMRARADNPRLQALLQALRNLRVQRFVTDDPAADLEPLGLKPPQLEIAFQQGTNDLRVLQLGGSPTNAAELLHARRLGSPTVVLLPKASVALLRGSFEDFRDRRLLSFPPVTAERIEVQAEDRFALERGTNALWRLVEPTPAPADRDLMREFLAALGEIEAVKFIKDVVTDYAPYGLAQPSRRYLLSRPVNSSAGPTNELLVQLEFGATNEDQTVFARRTDESSVYAVPLASVQALPHAAFQLRDRRLWTFAPTNVTGILVKLRAQSHRLERNPAGDWKPAPGTQGVVNSLAVEEMLRLLGTLTADTWVARGADKLPEYGVPEAAHELTLEVTRGGASETLTVAFGRMAESLRPYAAMVLDGQPTLFEFPLVTYGLYWEAMRGVVPGLPPPVR
jgi:hypothetical protein